MSKVGFMGSETERFWKRVTILENGCWQWTGAMSSGYGMFGEQRKPGAKRNRMTSAHIWSYKNTIGPIPPGLELDHTCRNRACVNPLHLEPVTHRINVLRGSSIPAENEQKEFCKRGHEFTPENTYPRPNGGRTCRACFKIRRKNPAVSKPALSDAMTRFWSSLTQQQKTQRAKKSALTRKERAMK
jgi:hypothetical protein